MDEEETIQARRSSRRSSENPWSGHWKKQRRIPGKKIKKILLLEAGSDEAPPRVHSVDVQCATLLSRIVQPVGQCTFGLTHGRF